MLIEIDHTVSGLVRNGLPETTGARAAMENLLRAHHEGKHLLLFHDNAIPPILQCSALSDFARGVAKSVASKSSETMGLRNVLRTFVKLIPSDASEGVTNTAGQQIRHLCYRRFTDSARTQATILLAENRRDARLLLLVADAAARQVGWRINLEAELRGGGGNTTADELQAIVASGRLCSCIVDSDIRHPNGSIGETARRVLAVTITIAQQVYRLQSRELENTFPFSLVSSALIANRRPQIELHTYARQKIRGDWPFFLDLKDGLTLREVRSEYNDYGTSYWESVTEDLHTAGLCAPMCDQLLECGDEDDCRCMILPPLGTDILDRLLAHLESQSTRRRSQVIRLDAREADLGPFLIAWMVAATPNPSG